MKVKLYLKIVCITLCTNIILLFFSSFNIVAAASAVGGTSVPFVSLSCSEQDVFRSALERFVKDCLGYDSSPDVSFTMPDGTVYYGTKSEIMEQIRDRANEEYISAIQDSDGLTLYYVFSHAANNVPYVLIDEFCSTTHKSYLNGIHGGAGRLRVSSSSYNSSVSDFVSNSAGSAIGATSGVNTAISVINGKPQKVTTTYTPEVIEAFENLGVNYTMTPSVTDIHLYKRSGGLSSNVVSDRYYGFFIISNGNLYLLGSPSSSSTPASLVHYSWYSNWSSFQLYMDYVFQFSRSSSPSSPYLPSDYVQEVKLCEVDGRFCIAGYQYNINQSKNSAYEYQILCGDPEPTLYPTIFDKPVFSVNPKCQTSLLNRQMSNICFYNILDESDIFLESNVIGGNYECCGYISGLYYTDFTKDSSLGSAAQIIGQHSTAVSGGLQTTTNDLSDIEKAIYLLAQQQGIGYEQMLEQSNVIFDEYQTYIEGLNGQIYSLTSLISDYERFVEQGQLSADLAQSNSEQIKAILSYLQGLDIESLNSYLQQLESTLDELKQGDKDREVVLGDISLQLEELKNRLDSLGLDSVGSDIKSISDNLSKLLNTEISSELDISETIDKFNTPDSITTKFPFSLPFDVYNIFNILSAEPVAPQFEIPLDFTTLGGEVYTIDIDLSEYDFIANIVRWLLYGVFLIGLILVTNRLIGRG